MGRLLLGLMVFGAGAWGLVSLQERGDRIRAEKTVVSAYVVGPRGARHWKVVRVEYVFDRRLYRTDLLDIGWTLPPASGEQFVLAIDPERPTQAAGPGLVSGSAWRYWYQPVGFGGIVIALVALWQLLRSRLRPKWEKSGPAVARVLLHPAPVWAEKADGTVKTLILIPGETGLTWDEELPVRRLDAVTAELCCVPFLQMRLALGDVARIGSDGYVGEVTDPSGRVTFAVRRTDPTSDVPDLRGLTDEFPATVVEDVGAGKFAIAAPSAEKAGAVHTRLQDWEQAGLVEYRSLLRFDQADAPLL